MTKAKIREVLNIYKEELVRRNFSRHEFSHDKTLHSRIDSLQHVFAMIDKIEEFLEEDRMEKVFRWLGFIQGCLWASGLYTIKELKNHSRPS